MIFQRGAAVYGFGSRQIAAASAADYLLLLLLSIHASNMRGQSGLSHSQAPQTRFGRKQSFTALASTEGVRRNKGVRLGWRDRRIVYQRKRRLLL